MNKIFTLSGKETQLKAVKSAGIHGLSAAHMLKELCGEHYFPLLKVPSPSGNRFREENAYEIFLYIPIMETEYESN
jgi:hypothetical protein